VPPRLKEALFRKTLLSRMLEPFGSSAQIHRKLLFAEHHQSHAASAFYPSPFTDAVVLTIDGVGEWATTSVALGRGTDLQLIKAIHFPHSLGLLYSSFTAYAGFLVNSGEYKLMGLAPYGEPKYTALILDNLMDIKADGSFRLNLEYFDYCTGATMTNERFGKLFGGPQRRPDEPIAQRHMDLAASIQRVTEEVVLRLTGALAAETGDRNLCLAGGVALNCVANSKIARNGRFENLWIQPAAGDAGGALGAAFCAYHLFAGRARFAGSDSDLMRGAYLGPSFSTAEIAQRLDAAGARHATLAGDDIVDRTAAALESGKAVGWFQGRMEFGPRALGNRSILGDARSPTMQNILNRKIKYRESFRPFAPAVLREDVADWFEFDGDSPYMLLVADVAERHRRPLTPEEQRLMGFDKLTLRRSDIPAVTHVDFSARLQTVHRATNPRFHALLSRFKARTGCPVIVNTSFNVRGEPIVCTPEDAFRCFMGTEMDTLVVGDCLLEKTDQDPRLKIPYRQTFAPD
jgi:carbamoyltransferase